MVERAVFCRNYAEELRIKADERRDYAQHRLLLKAAEEFERMAVIYEGMARTVGALAPDYGSSGSTRTSWAL
jgi:hypothetical protein